MMYNQKLAVAIKSAGKVLREFKDTVYVPFGAEYSILLKNLNTQRALVKVSIDNTEVCEDGLVLDANSTLELERFVKDLTKGNRFKFIERTGRVEEARGIKLEDGLIRVEFQFEKQKPKTVYHDVYHETRHHYYDKDYWDWYYGRPYYRPWVTYTSAGSCGGYGDGYRSLINSQGCGSVSGRSASGLVNAGSNAGGEVQCSNTVAVNLCNSVGAADSFLSDEMSRTADIPNEAGITVPGSLSEQQFTTVSSFDVEDEKHVIVLKLLGETSKGKRVAKPVTVKSKQKCVTCGHLNKATAKFCTECGTALEIV